MTPSKPGREEECQTRDCPACVAAGCCRCDATVADAHTAGFREGLERAAEYVSGYSEDWAEQLSRELLSLLEPSPLSPTPPAAAPECRMCFAALARMKGRAVGPWTCPECGTTHYLAYTPPPSDAGTEKP